MEKPVRSSLQNLSISYECALAIGNSLNLSEMLHKVIHTMVHKTNAHRGIIWVKNGEQELQPVASAGINIEDVPARGEIKDLRDVLNQIQKSRQFVLRYKDDEDFLQYCHAITGKEESVLIVPVTNVAILHLVYAGREIADEPLANLLTGLSKKLSIAIEACMAHENIIKEIQVRKKAEKELTKKTEQLISSEEKYRTIYDSSNDAIMTLTPEEGFFSGNPAAIEIFGCKNEKDFISRTPYDLSPHYQPDGKLSSEKAKQMMAIAMKKGSHFFEWTHARMDGKEFPTTVLLTRMKLQGRRVLQATVRDITKQKAADNALRESEEKYRNIIENIQDIFYRGDMEGNLVMISASGAKQMGYDSVEAMIGLDIAKTFYAVPEEREGFLKVLEKTGMVNDYEITLKKKDGTLMPVRASSQLYFDKSGKPLGVEGLFSDITERKAAEGEINKKTDKLEKINKLAVGRELKMIELKKEINTLLGKLGEKPEYKIVGDA